MRPKVKAKMISIRVGLELLDRLAAVAKHVGRDKSELIRRGIVLAIREAEKKARKGKAR